MIKLRTRLKALWQLFWAFFKIGSFTFGGGLAMLPLIQKEVVDKQKWTDEEEILEIFALSQSLPGVISINTSIFVGNRVAGIFGAIAAIAGTALPAFISIILVLVLLMQFKDNIYVEKVFSGIKAASAALILLAAVKLGKSAVKGKTGLVIAAASFLAIVLFNVSAAWAVILGGLAGFILYLLRGRSADERNP